MIKFTYSEKNYFIIFSLILLSKFILATLTFGGGDTNNFAYFYTLQFNDYDIYSIKSPYPYFPFANFINIIVGRLADLSFLNFNIILKFNAIIFDFFIGYNVYLYLLQKTGDKNLSLKIFLFYLLNPVTIFIACFLGFTDSMIILLLLYVCRLNDFKLPNNFLIPIVLTISLSIKPVCILFFPYFFINSFNKINFVIISFLTFIVLNSFYFFNFENIENLIYLIKYILLKITYGHQVSFHGLGLIRNFLENYSFFLILVKIMKYTGIFLIILINIYLLKKLKSNEFVLFSFLIIFIFSDHVHLQYFSWIIPFLMITSLDKKKFVMIVNLSILILIYSLKWVDNNNMGLIIFPEGFNIHTQNLYLNQEIFSNLIPLLILIYFYPLVLIFIEKLKPLKEEFLNYKFNFFIILKIFFKKNEALDKLELKNFCIFSLIIFLIIFIFNFKDLYNNDKKTYSLKQDVSLVNYKIFKFPKSITNSFYGEKYSFETNISKNDLKNEKLYLRGNHVYEIQIENKTIFKSLGYDYSDDVGGKNYLFASNNNLKIDLSEYFQNSKTIKLALILKNYHPYRQPSIKYSYEDLVNKLNWEIKYKNDKIDYIEEVIGKDIFIRSNLEIKNKFIDNKLIFILFQIFILAFFVLFWKRNFY